MSQNIVPDDMNKSLVNFGCYSRWTLMQSWLGVLTASLDSGIDVEEIKVGPGKFGKKNKCRTTTISTWQSL